jgi:hypothetical protein
MRDKLQFRRVNGEPQVVEADIAEAETPVGEYLMARKVVLEGDAAGGSPGSAAAGTTRGTELRQHRPVGGDRRLDGYQRLDNEILAGRRLHDAADWSGYPPEVARLYGDEAVSAEPYTLWLPYQGLPLREVGAYLLTEEFEKFTVSLLTGLCWLATVGIVHRAISPDTVHWDGQRGRVQITDFSRSTVFGTARTPVAGSHLWVPKEQRAGTCYGLSGPADDAWAAGRLIYYVGSHGEDLEHRGQLAETGLEDMFRGQLGMVFGPPEGRPTASDLLEYGLGRRNSLPSADGTATRLIAAREVFLQARGRKHPSAPVPPELHADLAWTSRLQSSGGAGEPSPAGMAGPGGSGPAARPPGYPPGPRTPGEDTTRNKRRWGRGE